jgi:hypothetical protein
MLKRSKIVKKLRLLYREPDGSSVFESVGPGWSELVTVNRDGSTFTESIGGICGGCMQARWEGRERCDWPECPGLPTEVDHVEPELRPVPPQHAGHEPAQVESEPVTEEPGKTDRKGFNPVNPFNPRDPQYEPPREPPVDSARGRRLRWGPGPGRDW